jgi:hypothetical protein
VLRCTYLVNAECVSDNARQFVTTLGSVQFCKLYETLYVRDVVEALHVAVKLIVIERIWDDAKCRKLTDLRVVVQGNT